MSRADYDIAVIGTGVVGCAVARRFALEGARVIVLEKAADLLDGASKGNSGVLHTGFDAPSGSLEWACMREGHAEYLEVKDRLRLPTIMRGAVMVAFEESQLAGLEKLEKHAARNQVPGVRLLDRHELFAREPHLSAAALAALLIPGECVVDPWATPLAYLRQAVANGAEVRFRAEVTGGALDGGIWRLQVGSDCVSASLVINCAGNFGDIVDQRVLGAARFTIRPRKGQFVVFDKAASLLVNSIILPIPTKHTKGVLVTRTVFGNVLVGPTAEEQRERDRPIADERTARELIAKAIAIVPELAAVHPIAAYAGLRPATDVPEYRIDSLPERRWITVGGIRSTGLTSALGIARYVFDLYSKVWSLRHTAIAQPAWPSAPVLGPGDLPEEIVCECEKVTAREIEAALSGPLPARDLGGLKRRTRIALGRCQGRDCLARVAELAANRLEPFSRDYRAVPLGADAAPGNGRIQ